MLRALRQNEFDCHVDFAYALAMDLTKSVYPTYADGIKTREDFVGRARKAFDRENEEILLFEDCGEILGWIHYFVWKEDDYVSFCAFNVKRNAEQAIDEFMEYVSEKCHGCTLYFGLPAQNSAVISHLEKLGFLKESEDYVDVLFFDGYGPVEEESGMIKVSKENYEEFRKLHQARDGDMYWNCQRIYEDLDRWHIYLRYRAGAAIGAIYYCFYENGMMEIFGVDYGDGYFDEDTFRTLLVKALNEGKRDGVKSLTFFNSEQEHPVVSELDFTHISKYVLYTNVIE